MPRTIAEHLREEMLKTDAKRAWAGDPNLLLAAYEHSGGRVVHPLDRIRAVLAAARRSPLFKDEGGIRACDATGKREVLHPSFVLTNINTERDA